MSLIQIQQLSFSYPGSYTSIFEGVNLQLDSSWKLGLIGRNGRGKTTFFRLLLANMPIKERLDMMWIFVTFLIQLLTRIK